MSDKPTGESKYAQRARKAARMYGPCRCGPYDDALKREIADVIFWVARIRERTRDFGRAVTLDDIREAKEAAKPKAA